MAEATYDSPIVRKPKVGIVVHGMRVNRFPPYLIVTIADVDEDGTVVSTSDVNITAGSPSPLADIGDFWAALMNDNAGNPHAKISRRTLQFLKDRGVLGNVTVA